MRWRAARVWVWAIVVALTLQLAFLHGHSHGPHDSELSPRDGHAHAFHAHEETHHNPHHDEHHHHPHEADGGHGHHEHDHDGHHARHGHLAVEDGSTGGTDAPAHDHSREDCSICWVLTALNALVLPFLLCLLLGAVVSRSRTFARSQVRASKIPFTLYLARAPPLNAIHI